MIGLDEWEPMPDALEVLKAYGCQHCGGYTGLDSEMVEKNGGEAPCPYCGAKLKVKA